MKTSELIDALATGAGAVPRAFVARRLVPAAIAGWVLAAVAALVLMGPAPAEMLYGVALWTKLAYAGVMAVAAGLLTARLARPVSRTRGPAHAVAGIVAVMLLAGLLSLAATPSGERAPHLLGHSWLMCPWGVLALSLPSLAGALQALRTLAPTRPRMAGLAAGLLAGSLGALGYALACPEVSITFVAIWYSLGIALAAALGAWLGPRVLHW
jgi:hypothetical protein